MQVVDKFLQQHLQACNRTVANFQFLAEHREMVGTSHSMTWDIFITSRTTNPEHLLIVTFARGRDVTLRGHTRCLVVQCPLLEDLN
jgi:hypothetical protein